MRRKAESVKAESSWKYDFFECCVSFFRFHSTLQQKKNTALTAGKKWLISI